MSSGLLNKFLNMVGLEDVDEEEENFDYEDAYPEDEYGDYPDEEYFDDAPRRDKRKGGGGKVVGLPTTQSSLKMRVVVYQPTSNEDTQDIIDSLKQRKPVIINLDDLDIEVAQRALDFISGAVYALNANIQKVARSIYVCTPNGVDISTNNESNEGTSIRAARR